MRFTNECMYTDIWRYTAGYLYMIHILLSEIRITAARAHSAVCTQIKIHHKLSQPMLSNKFLHYEQDSL